ncbi:murein hydrolase activator EnvC family protein [Alkaliphilus hydrothermalis]|uniref:Murein DD-endopeptidase MepM/ murein hydrolase activator NlpD n=1 Tax=Alkaliphilus hydrothermalis TaxID=1482730 RepID=A0ABS2NMT7_9FIRM|nr:peptidoglycan DD-metalloendopeptidase family protein [Alkaliphilus hydrothermalis]MBM7614245.1 murein DD-endopeptidase MepM/ murein hydrolase activator NlpD [Alkaliphilus hydrothermalis]
MRYLKVSFAVVMGLIILISSTFVFGNQTNAIKQQIASTTKKLERLEKDISKNKQLQKSAFTQIQKLELEIDIIEKEITLLEKDISSTQKNIDKTTVELVKSEEIIDDKNELLGSRINVMYRRGNIGYAEVILSSKSLPELLSNLDMVKKIVQHDVDLLKELKIQRDAIEDKKVQLETDKKELIGLKNNVVSKQKNLQVSRSQQERYRKELMAEGKELEKLENQFEREIEESQSKLRRLQSNNTQYAGGVMAWPVPGYSRISSPYGNRIHPILKTKRFHSGIDIPAPTGVAIVAANAGKVVHSGDMGGYGRVLIIDHGGGIMTLYAHNSRLLVSVGDQVTRGQKVALAGSTGMSTGPHLHFEVRKNGSYVDPTPYIR